MLNISNLSAIKETAMKQFVNLWVLSGLVLSLFPQEAQAAYLDPGSGSFLIQIIIAGLVGFSFFIKLFWKNIKLFFANLLSKEPKQE